TPVVLRGEWRLYRTPATGYLVGNAPVAYAFAESSCDMCHCGRCRWSSGFAFPISWVIGGSISRRYPPGMLAPSDGMIQRWISRYNRRYLGLTGAADAADGITDAAPNLSILGDVCRDADNGSRSGNRPRVANCGQSQAGGAGPMNS